MIGGRHCLTIRGCGPFSGSTVSRFPYGTIISLKGQAMKPVRIELFTVRGPSVRTNNASEASGSGKLAGLWAHYYESHPPSSETVYGVYSDYESNASGEYTVTAGTRTSSAGDFVVTVKPGTYLEFQANGKMPGAIMDAWKSVWEFFSKNQPYERAFETDFEQYNGPASATIYIGVKASG